MQYTVTVWVYVKCSVKVNNEVCMYENVATAVCLLVEMGTIACTL